MRFSLLAILAGIIGIACTPVNPTPPATGHTPLPAASPIYTVAAPQPLPPHVTPTAIPHAATAAPAAEATPVPHLPTATPAPTLFPTPAPARTANPQQTTLITVMAYAYCNGRYFGEQAEHRYNLTMAELEQEHRTVPQVAEDVNTLCQGNFDAPRTYRPPPTPTPTPTAAAPAPDTTSEAANAFTRREYLYDLLNQARTAAGLEPYQRSANTAAQQHAEYGRDNCVTGYWNRRGHPLPYLYHQAGGGERLVARWWGYTSCANAAIPARQNWQTAARAIVTQLTREPDSPLLDLALQHVAIGVAWNPNQRWTTLIFEQDWLEFDAKPTIAMASGTAVWHGKPLQLSRFRAGMTALINPGITLDTTTLLLRIYYAPGPAPLTRHQITALPYHFPGTLVAIAVPSASLSHRGSRAYPNAPQCTYSARPDPSPPIGTAAVECYGGRHLPQHRSPTPGGANRSAAPPLSLPDYAPVWRSFDHLPGVPVTVPLIPTADITVANATDDPRTALSVSANIHQALTANGNGIYTLELWGLINGAPRLIATGSSVYENP